jgi:hypothetical protein
VRLSTTWMELDTLYFIESQIQKIQRNKLHAKS